MVSKAASDAADGSRNHTVLTAEAVWAALEDVADPEIPALSVVELGMVRDVEVEPAPRGESRGSGSRACGDGNEAGGAASEAGGARVRVDITPTFAGCPAFHAITEAVEARVRGLGAGEVRVRRVLSPAWSSDDMTDTARAKLKAFGLAPPEPHGGLLLPALDAPVPCPRCGSFDTELRNAFGSALCREIHTCRACGEPFERFKPL